MISSQNISLWQLANEHQRLFSQLYNEETGEIDMEIQAQLDVLEPSTEKKCIAIQSWVNKLESEDRELDILIDQIGKRKSAYSKEIKKMSDYLYNNMKRCGIKEIRCPLFKLRIKVNPYSTEIFEETQIPKQFMKTREIVKTETKPDKNAIKEEVLKTGIQVPGAFVQQKEKLEISLTKI